MDQPRFCEQAFEAVLARPRPPFADETQSGTPLPQLQYTNVESWVQCELYAALERGLVPGWRPMAGEVPIRYHDHEGVQRDGLCDIVVENESENRWCFFELKVCWARWLGHQYPQRSRKDAIHKASRNTREGFVERKGLVGDLWRLGGLDQARTIEAWRQPRSFWQDWVFPHRATALSTGDLYCCASLLILNVEDDEDVDFFRQELRRQYHGPLQVDRRLTDGPRQHHVFAFHWNHSAGTR